MSDRLGELLRGADAAVSPPVLPSGLARAILAAHARRRSRRIAIGTGLALAAASVAIFFAAGRPSSRTPARAPLAAAPVERLKAELAHLRADGDLHEAVAERLLAIERQRDRAETAASLPDPLTEIDACRDAAARRLVVDARRWSRREETKARALAAYRRVVEIFPDSPWATVACERLEEFR